MINRITHIAQSWKFFDPLASPTGEDHEELLRLEAMLDAKARKANQGLILETRPDIIASHSELKSKKKPEKKSKEKDTFKHPWLVTSLKVQAQP